MLINQYKKKRKQDAQQTILSDCNSDIDSVNVNLSDFVNYNESLEYDQDQATLNTSRIEFKNCTVNNVIIHNYSSRDRNAIHM